MITDLRFDADYFDNVKVLLLLQELGPDGVLSHIRLLCYTRKFRPNGELVGMDARRIAVAARWAGDADRFCQTLSELILIERSDAGQWRIHDWLSANAWAAGSEGRSAHARKLNHKRWYVSRGIACADLQCVECAAFRESGSVQKSELIQSGASAESASESSSRSVTSRSVKRKLFEEDSDALRLAALLHLLIRERDARHSADLQKEARHVDLIIRKDGRSAHDVEKIIRWAQSDSFWQNNVLCTEKLRRQFQQLFLKSRQGPGPMETFVPIDRREETHGQITDFFAGR